MHRRVDGVEVMMSPGGAAPREFGSCAGSGGQARRRREGVGCCEERRQTKELHGPKLALGNAYFVPSCAASDLARQLFAARARAAMLCACRERPASTNSRRQRKGHSV